MVGGGCKGTAGCTRCKDHKMHWSGGWLSGGRTLNEEAATRKDTLRLRCVPNCPGKDVHGYGYGCGCGVRVVNSFGKYPLLVKLHNPLNTGDVTTPHLPPLNPPTN